MTCQDSCKRKASEHFEVLILEKTLTLILWLGCSGEGNLSSSHPEKSCCQFSPGVVYDAAVSHNDSLDRPLEDFLYAGSCCVAVPGGKTPQFALSQLFIGTGYAKDKRGNPALGLMYVEDQVGHHKRVGRLVKEHHFVEAASINMRDL